MVRQVQVTVPAHKTETILQVLKTSRSVHHLQVFPTRDGSDEMILFKIVTKRTEEILHMLRRYGVPDSFGTIDIVQLAASKPRVTTIAVDSESEAGGKKKKAYASHDRRSYDEIFEMIDNGLHLTFDYLALIGAGSVIAAGGLLTDSSVSVVASMLVSPLMGPILGMTFGTIVQHKEMFLKGFRNELLGVLLCFFCGTIMGFIAAQAVDVRSPTLILNSHGTTEMSSRGTQAGLIWGALIAIPSGVGAGIGVTSDTVSALIGVAISAALLPPIVNSGLSLAISVVLYAKNDSVWSNFAGTGSISMALFLINWALIYVVGIITFRVKRLNQQMNEESFGTNLGAFNSGLDRLRSSADNLSAPLLDPSGIAMTPTGVSANYGDVSGDVSAADFQTSPSVHDSHFSTLDPKQNVAHSRMVSTPVGKMKKGDKMSVLRSGSLGAIDDMRP